MPMPPVCPPVHCLDNPDCDEEMFEPEPDDFMLWMAEEESEPEPDAAMGHIALPDISTGTAFVSPPEIPHFHYPYLSGAGG